MRNVIASPRRRRYIVTFRKQRGETDTDCDERLLRLLGVDADTEQVDVTVTAYEPSTHDFRSLVPPPLS